MGHYHFKLCTQAKYLSPHIYLSCWSHSSGAHTQEPLTIQMLNSPFPPESAFRTGDWSVAVRLLNMQTWFHLKVDGKMGSWEHFHLWVHVHFLRTEHVVSETFSTFNKKQTQNIPTKHTSNPTKITLLTVENHKDIHWNDFVAEHACKCKRH